MDWSTPIDQYCERIDASFWSEPANALTNIAFLIAAAVAFASWRRAGGRDWPALALIAVVVVVGLGSFIFHTVATRGARLADIIPIAVFIYGYLLLALRRFLHCRPPFQSRSLSHTPRARRRCRRSPRRTPSTARSVTCRRWPR
jgi:uncharacterized membrane protein YfcA